MINSPEYHERLKQENIKNVERIKKIAGGELTNYYHIFYDNNSHAHNVTLVIASDEDGLGDFPSDPPDNFTFPIVYIDGGNFDDADLLFTTSHGILPQFVIGPDGNLYRIDNGYLFTNDGRAVKKECFIDEGTATENSYFIDSLKKESDLLQIDFIPTIQDNRFTSLEPGDYELIGSFLDRIELSELT